MAGWHTQIQGLPYHSTRDWLDHHRLRIQQGRTGKAADIETTVEIGITNADGYPNIGRHSAMGQYAQRRCNKNSFHLMSSISTLWETPHAACKRL